MALAGAHCCTASSSALHGCVGAGTHQRTEGLHVGLEHAAHALVHGEVHRRAGVAPGAVVTDDVVAVYALQVGRVETRNHVRQHRVYQLTCDAGPADNLALMAELEALQPGDVLVAATGGYTGCAVTGDLVLGMARNCGAVGFVTDGCVRDLPGIRAVGLPCYCVGVTPNSPARSGPGSVGLAVTIAGHPVTSGDVIVGDADGVVVVPQGRLEEVIGRLPAIRKAEAELDQAVRGGLRVPGFLAKD